MNLLPLAIGHAIKAIAILAKLAFIILVVPGMAKGEFANYFVDLTIALLAGRVLSCCAEDQILLVSRGQPSRERFFAGSLHVAFLVALAATLASLAWTASPRVVTIASAATTIATLSYAAGMVRGNSPLAFELISNARWLLLLILAVFTHAATARELIAIFNVSTIATLAIALLAMHRAAATRRLPAFDLRGYVYLLFRYPSWTAKVISNGMLLLNLRSVPVFLKVLGRQVDDSLAIAFSIGEVCWQLCMVFVNRTYSRLATAFGESRRPSWVPGFFVCAGVTTLSALGIFVISATVPNAHWQGALDLPLVYAAILYCGAVALFSWYRAYSWFLFRRRRGLDVLAYQVALAASALGAVVLIDNLVIVTVLVSAAAVLLYMIFFNTQLRR